MANSGASVLFTIHQPASEIFGSFDRVILLNHGRVMYQGSVADVPSYFSQRGQPVPAHHNPGDWIMWVSKAVSIQALNEAGFFPNDQRILSKAMSLESSSSRDALGISITDHNSGFEWDDTPVSQWTETSLLLQREFQDLWRDKFAIAGRFGFTTLLSFLIGTIFYKVGESDPGNISVSEDRIFEWEVP